MRKGYPEKAKIRNNCSGSVRSILRGNFQFFREIPRSTIHFICTYCRHSHKLWELYGLILPSNQGVTSNQHTRKQLRILGSLSEWTNVSHSQLLWQPTDYGRPNFSRVKQRSSTLLQQQSSRQCCFPPLTQSDSHTFAHLRSLNSSDDKSQNVLSWKYQLHSLMFSEFQKIFSFTTQSQCWRNVTASLPNVQKSTDTNVWNGKSRVRGSSWVAARCRCVIFREGAAE